MLGLLITVGTVLLVAIYAYAILPFPYFTPHMGAGPVKDESNKRLTLLTLLKALRHPRPRWEMDHAEISRMMSLFREPERPYVSWRNSSGYYDLQAGSQDSATQSCLVFRSRLFLVLLWPRLMLDRPLSWFLNRLNLAAFCLVIALTYILMRLSALRNKQRIKNISEPLKYRLSAHFTQHLEAFVPAEGRGELSIFAEPGYFFFKLAEGRLFRQALSCFPPKGPSLDIGPDDGVISLLHLAPVLFIDYGLNTSDYAFSGAARSKYGAIKKGFIEDDIFPNGSFSSIFMIHVVDHIPDLEGALKHLASLLKPGGRLYFSGLSHDFNGWWLERICAAGAVWNNRPITWYRDLCARQGLETLHASYCQAVPGNMVWKATYAFAMKTAAWRQLARWLGATSSRRRKWASFLTSMWMTAFLLDEELAVDRGLNFMMVVQKADQSA